MLRSATLTKEFWQPSPMWRWHGLGMLQREISESARVHIWHPSLVRVPPGFRRVHDHRFDLTSLVLAGELVDKPYSVTFGIEDPPWRAPANTHAWHIVHAKVQRAVSEAVSGKPSSHPTNPGDDPDVDHIGKVFARCENEHRRVAGEVYRIERGAFHESDPRTLAITLVSRENFHREQQARVLGDTAHSAIAGQHHEMRSDDAIVTDVLRRAALVMGCADDIAAKMTRG